MCKMDCRSFTSISWITGLVTMTQRDAKTDELKCFRAQVLNTWQKSIYSYNLKYLRHFCHLDIWLGRTSYLCSQQKPWGKCPLCHWVDRSSTQNRYAEWPEFDLPAERTGLPLNFQQNRTEPPPTPHQLEKPTEVMELLVKHGNRYDVWSGKNRHTRCLREYQIPEQVWQPRACWADSRVEVDLLWPLQSSEGKCQWWCPSAPGPSPVQHRPSAGSRPPQRTTARRCAPPQSRTAPRTSDHFERWKM